MSEQKDILNEAREIISLYAQKCSTIDEGNLYFAATQFEQAYEDLQKAFDDLAETFTRVMGVNQKMNNELAMHIKLFEQIQDWGLAGNIINYKDLTDKLEQIQEEHDQPTLNSHPPVDDGSDEAF